MNNTDVIKWAKELADQEYAGNIIQVGQNARHPSVEGFK